MSLHRKLGMMDVFAIAVGAMISSGLFILPGLAYALTGPSVVLAYLLAGVLAIPALLSKCELATAMPKAGGTYFFIDRSMGPAMGTLGGAAGWFSLSFKTAFSLVGMSAFTGLLFPDLSADQLRLVAAGLCVLFTIINLWGVHHVGRLQVVMVIGLIGILAAYAVVGLPQIEGRRFAPLLGDGYGGLLAAAGLVFVAFGGMTKAASIAEEVKNPGRDLPRGMILAFIVVLILYTTTTLVTVGVVDGELLAGSLTPINLGADATIPYTVGLTLNQGPSTVLGYGFNLGVAVVTVAALLAFISTANAGILAASRMPLAMGRDGLLPRFFQRIHQRRGTPTIAILFTSGFMLLVILLFDLEGLVKTASTLKLLLFMLVNASVILMRESRLTHYKPSFHAPFYPWAQILGIIAYGLLIAAMGTLPLILSAVFIALSLGWYYLYGRRAETRRASALVHVVHRIAGRELRKGTLDAELKEIVRQRDNFAEDRFESLLGGCNVLDLAGSLTLPMFIEQVSQSIHAKVGVASETLSEQLLARERELSTVLMPSLAVPHVVVPGKGIFEIVLARCNEGIHFSSAAPAVKLVFVLIASEDERNFHLKALVAIAKLGSLPDFEPATASASSAEELRALLLRRRRSAL